MKLVDSNVMIAFANPDDQLHQRALKFDLLEAIINEPIFFEVANVLERRVKNSKRTIEMVREITRAIPMISITSDDFKTGLSLFEKKIGKLSFTDSVFIAQAHRLSYSLVSFDERVLETAEGLGIETN